MKKLKRIWRPIETWEEIPAGMWSEVQSRAEHLARAIEFTGDHERYGRYMMRVVEEWPNSCANALTDYSLNRKAWIGHAACALAIGCPEDIVRQAWGLLSDEQRALANRQADRAIQSWEMRHGEGGRVCADVAPQVLFH